jgi:hypothetical protein
MNEKSIYLNQITFNTSLIVFVSVHLTFSFIFLFSAGASLVAGLTSAGIGLKVNFDSASDCDRIATRLRDGASVERRKIEDQHKRKCELLTEKQNIHTEIYTYERTISRFTLLNTILTTFPFKQDNKLLRELLTALVQFICFKCLKKHV